MGTLFVFILRTSVTVIWIVFIISAMKKFFIFLGIVTVGLLCAWNFATTRPGEQRIQYDPSNMKCFSEGDRGRYCIHDAKQGTNGGLVYFFHGRNLDEHTWNDDTFYTALIQKYWSSHNQKPPTVVTVSYGPIWLLSKKNGLEKSGLLDVFITQTLPKIESQISFVPSYRAVMGESMGGLNSLIVGLSYPEKFQKIVALCPPVYKISPFDPFSALWNEIKETGAEPRTIAGIVFLARDYVRNSADWDAINPLYLMKTFSLDYKNSIYLSSALYDKYGLFSGSEQLATIAKERGIPITWQPLYGGHCAVDVSSVAETLLH